MWKHNNQDKNKQKQTSVFSGAKNIGLKDPKATVATEAKNKR